MSAQSTSALKILVFSHRPEIREAIITAVATGPRRTWPGGLPGDRTIEDVLFVVDNERIDLAILDGEAQPTGGMGVSRPTEERESPTVPDRVASAGATTAGWPPGPRRTPVIVHPLDPLAAAETVAEVLRAHQPAGRARLTCRTRRPGPAYWAG